MLTGHHEQLTDHTGALTDVLLDEFSGTDSDELAVGVMSDRPRKKRLSCTRWPVKKYTLWLSNSQCVENFWMLNWQFDDLLNLFDLLVEPSNHVVR